MKTLPRNLECYKFGTKPKFSSFFLSDFAIIMKSKLNFGFKLNFYWAWVHAWTLIFLHIKTRKKNQIQIWCFYLELVGFLLKCVEISWVLRAFSLFLHKEINKKAFFRNEHLYRSMDLSLTSLVCETLKKGKQFLFKSDILWNSKIRNKLRLPNIQLMVFYQIRNFKTFLVMIEHLNQY